jgi:stress response protein YsnF
VVEKETVPVERVRMGKETVTEQRDVGGEIRKEQIEIDDEVGNPRHRAPRENNQ